MLYAFYFFPVLIFYNFLLLPIFIYFFISTLDLLSVSFIIVDTSFFNLTDYFSSGFLCSPHGFISLLQ